MRELRDLLARIAAVVLLLWLTGGLGPLCNEVKRAFSPPPIEHRTEAGTVDPVADTPERAKAERAAHPERYRKR